MFKDGTVWRKRVEQAHRHPRSLERWVIVGAAARASHLTAARMTCSAVLRLWPCLPCVVELTAAALLVCSAFVCRDRTGRALPLHNQGAPHSAESAQPDGLRSPQSTADSAEQSGRMQCGAPSLIAKPSVCMQRDRLLPAARARPLTRGLIALGLRARALVRA
jgi:hypothetical protein